jgi:glycosyltransferase involved in cell wall biosynthesis
MRDLVLVNMAKICMYRLEYTDVIFDSRVLREAETLSEYHQVHIIDVLGDHSCKTEQKGNIQIERIELKSRSFPSSLFFKALKYMEFVIRASLRGMWKKCDAYHAHDFPTLLPALIAGKWNRAKVIYDSHELWTEMGNLSGLSYKIAKWLEGFLIRKVDRVLVANRSRAIIMVEMYQGISLPSVIMNCPPLEENIHLRNPRRLIESTGDGETGNRKIVLYQGGLSPGRGIENLVGAAEYFRDHIILILFGQGPLKEDLIQQVYRRGFEKKVFFHDYVPYSDLLDYTASADAGVITYQNTCLNNYYCAPNKLFEYVAAGLPVAACHFPELEHFVKEYGIGRLFDPDDPVSIAAAINGIFESETEYERMKQNTARVRENFNWAAEAKKLLNIYDELLERDRTASYDRK